MRRLIRQDPYLPLLKTWHLWLLIGAFAAGTGAAGYGWLRFHTDVQKSFGAWAALAGGCATLGVAAVFWAELCRRAEQERVGASACGAGVSHGSAAPPVDRRK